MQDFRKFPSSKMRVLVVDDDTDLRLTIAEYLESLNLTVSSARDGFEALAILRDPKFQFDIIFTDLMMPPGPNGLEVMRTAKQVNPLSYVVIMTGYSCLETALESIRRGAFDYVTKPFTLAELDVLVEKIKDHLSILDDNKRLSQRLASLTDQLEIMNSRLEKIESAICRIVANLPTGVQTYDT
jgi:DNA-binding NtrC family response regulator